MKKPVIFIDFGRVYFTYASHGLKPFFKKFNVTHDKMLKILVGGTNWTNHATGKTDEDTYWKYVAKKLNASDKQIDEIRTIWYNHPSVQDGMAKLIKNLKKKYTVAALSSITAPWIEVLEKNHNISEIFHDHHYSFDHGIDKPDAEFFMSAAKKLNVKPEDCIVVDDMKKFLSSVKKTGAKTILFKDAKQLERDLRKLGVEV